ncbi:alpha/beta fold hydrolase [Xenorhabdus kozodoii]|uniref:Serine aminopeptidase S33 domain-containing protein n=1 Tax=Xenorhabdus kozodoii TaxID=351676 RepID=A0A2D0L228_9GAMM|nr:alpha/beta fold hydrolase [Xenorhabdus kozodoii]PHM69739.1 hypothetical protein Xkoz_03361 [Xenorhabdus kozodoii]
MYDNKNITKKITRLYDGDLIIHSWIPNSIEAIIIYVHGLQSHASWSWEFALDFAQENTLFICMDRPGSGMNIEPHDEFPSADRIVSLYKSLFEYVFSLYPNIPVIAVGHCLGGSILTATLAQHPSLLKGLQSISIVSSWLGRMNTSLNKHELQSILNNDSNDLWDVGILPEDFSSNSNYQDFIRQDPLAIRKIKSRTRKNILALEEKYIYLNYPLTEVKSQYISSYGDRVIDTKLAVEEYIKYYGKEGTIHLLGSVDHYIPFTKYRRQLANMVLNMLHDVETVV